MSEIETNDNFKLDVTNDLVENQFKNISLMYFHFKILFTNYILIFCFSA